MFCIHMFSSVAGQLERKNESTIRNAHSDEAFILEQKYFSPPAGGIGSNPYFFTGTA
ncbi:MAG: hypothetical protein AAF824_20025 [Bacteroidota bacterium]